MRGPLNWVPWEDHWIVLCIYLWCLRSYLMMIDIGRLYVALNWYNCDMWESWSCSLFVYVDDIVYVQYMHVIILLYWLMYVILSGIAAWSYQYTVVVYWYCTCSFFVEYRASSSGYWQTSSRKSVIVASNSRVSQFFQAAMDLPCLSPLFSDSNYLFKL